MRTPYICLHRKWDISKHKIILYSDCDSILQKLRQRLDNWAKYALENDIDILLQIQKMKKELRCKVNIEYVLSHRDKVIRFQDASFPQQLNILMDEAVRKYIDLSVSISPR